MPRLQAGSRALALPRSRRLTTIGLCAVLTLAVFAGPISAQPTGRLSGQISDTDGAPLPGASVRVDSPQLMGSRTVFADADGSFSFRSLPPGVYTVAAELDGFVPQQRSEVEVRLGRVTDLHFEMVIGQFTEEILVVAETPVVDPEQVSTSQNFSTEYLKKAAVGSLNRSYTSVLTQAAGVAGGGNPNVFGSTLGENAFFIDGIDSTDPVTATFGINLNFDTVQEINFETGGFEARFGRATGGVVDVITKSGGNDFSGTLDVRYRDSDFNTNGEHFDKDENTVEFTEPSATLGGPIRTDELWFFTALNPVRSKSTPTASPTTRDFDGTNVMGKLTWQPNERWHVIARYLDETATIENANASRSVAAAATRLQRQPSSISSLEALNMPSSNLEWRLAAAAVRSELDSYPQSGDFDTIGHIDSFGDGSASVNYTNQQFSRRDRDELSTSLAWFVDDLAGDHEFRVGLETADLYFRSQNNSTGGGYVFRNRFGSPYVLSYAPIDPATESEGALLTMYVQDTWRLTPTLTLKLGLRSDQARFTNDIGSRIADLAKLQPRFGLAWDITGDAKTVGRVSWGRFMHPNALTLPDFARVQQSPSIRYLSCSSFRSDLGSSCQSSYPGETTVGDLAVPTWISDPQGFDPNGWFFFDSFSSSPARVDEGLNPTYADELIVGVEREITRRTSVGLTYVDKETADIFEDTCNGNRAAPAPDADCDYYVMANLPGLVRDYSGFILDFESRFTDWFHVLSSYTRSESKGNVEYTQNAGVAFDVFPDHFDNRYGYLSDHRKHRVKVNGYVDLPLDFTVGFAAFWSSPFVYEETRASEVYGRNYLEPRGNREANENYRLDLQIAKGFSFGRNLRLEFLAAVYNALDDEQTTDVCDRSEGCAGVDFGLPTDYRQPRWFEAGVRFEF